METSLVHSEKEMELMADRSERKQLWTNAEMRRADRGHFEEICCRVDKRERGTEKSKEFSKQAG